MHMQGDTPAPRVAGALNCLYYSMRVGQLCNPPLAVLDLRGHGAHISRHKKLTELRLTLQWGRCKQHLTDRNKKAVAPVPQFGSRAE